MVAGDTAAATETPLIEAAAADAHAGARVHTRARTRTVFPKQHLTPDVIKRANYCYFFSFLFFPVSFDSLPTVQSQRIHIQVLPLVCSDVWRLFLRAQ